MRRTRIDSTSERVRVMSAVHRVIDPPSTVPLHDDELPFFANIIGEFAKAEWSAHQIELASMLAMTMCAHNREFRLLCEEGASITGAMGSLVLNPRKQVVQMHAANIVSFRRSLALHAAAQGDKKDAVKRHSIAKDIESDSPFDDDGLIARPN